MNTVISDQHPQVCFLHCQKLRALKNCRKKRFIFGVLFSRKFIFGSFQADLFGRWGGGGGGGECIRTHRTFPAYAPDLNKKSGLTYFTFSGSCKTKYRESIGLNIWTSLQISKKLSVIKLGLLRTT